MEELQKCVFAHLQVEEVEIFPQARLLPPETLQELAAAMEKLLDRLWTARAPRIPPWTSALSKWKRSAVTPRSAGSEWSGAARSGLPRRPGNGDSMVSRSVPSSMGLRSPEEQVQPAGASTSAGRTPQEDDPRFGEGIVDKRPKLDLTV